MDAQVLDLSLFDDMASEPFAVWKRDREFYYLTHLDNVPSILERGILSHNQVAKEGLAYTPIYFDAIVTQRRHKEVSSGKPLGDYANLFLRPNNAMLYRVVCEKGASNIAVLGVKREVMRLPGVLVTDGNAASPYSAVYSVKDFKRVLKSIEEALASQFWKEEDGSKRKAMAEVLVPGSVPPEYIYEIYVASKDVGASLRRSISSGVHIIPEPRIFFQPAREISLTSNLTLAEGDMFFSRMQTLTISVNTVGVMGKGLASRAKYQFPEVYVAYQDACRKGDLQMGKPFLYKTEGDLDKKLAADPESLTCSNGNTWFLLFATKRHYREMADIEAIKSGLAWIEKNYQALGIKSIALPALGCGLGWLRWADVGPIMCRSLSRLNVQVRVYLPAEKSIPEDQLSKEFLLSTE